MLTYYVALIAILNLGLGYALARYLGAGRPQMATTSGELLEADTDHGDAGLDA